MIVVIPSCRRIELTHLSPLIDAGARFIVVDDTPGSIHIDHPRFTVLNWRDRRRLLGRNEAAVPRGNGACRNLGFYLAWKEADPEEIIVALDDDCVVGSEAFVGALNIVLSDSERPVAQGAGRHFNIFDLFVEPRFREIFPRGFPYSDRLGYRRWEFGMSQSSNVVFNVGLWRGIPDVNAVDCLGQVPLNFPEVDLIHPTVLVPREVLISACSGSMQFRARVIPAVFQLPMNVEIMPGWTINRFGDIWAGFLLKTLVDIRGDSMSVGGPLVHHLRQGPLDRNTRTEHLAHLVNEEFLEMVESLRENVRPGPYLDMIGQVRDQMSQIAPRSSAILRAYLGCVMESLEAWVEGLSHSAGAMA